MVELLHSNTLRFSFPEVHPDAVLHVSLKRTLRVDHASATNPLPMADMSLPMEHVADHAESVSSTWRRHGGVMLGLYQSEAMCLEFNSPKNFPFAVKVATGKRCAITGEPWVEGLMTGEMLICKNLINLQNYLVVPPQQRLDGYKTEQGVVRQFVAVPMGEGKTIEEQLTGSSEVGGIQIQVYPVDLKVITPQNETVVFEKHAEISPPRPVLRNSSIHDPSAYFALSRKEDWPSSGGWWNHRRDAKERATLPEAPQKKQEPETKNRKSKSLSIMACYCPAFDSKIKAPKHESSIEKSESKIEMGLAAGGRIEQLVFKDSYKLEDWDCKHSSRVFVHLLNATHWQRVTGKNINRVPFDEKTYISQGVTWSSYFADAESVVGSQLLDNVKPLDEVRQVQEG